MRILQVISYFYPAWAYGGPGKLVYELSKQLARLNNQVTVYSTNSFDATRGRKQEDNLFLKNENINVRFFTNISNSLAYRYKLFLPLNSIGTIQRVLRKFDIIHIHEFFTPLAIITSFFAYKYRIPFIISAHGTLDSFHLAHRRFIKSIFMKLFGIRIIKKASKFIAVTREEVNDYRSLGITLSRISHIPNGLDISDYTILPPFGLFRKKFAIAPNKKLIIYLGRIHKLKGLELLVKAFAKLIKKIDSNLVIIGSDDGYLNTLKILTEEYKLPNKVIFPGILFGEKKLEAYRDADAFVYPSPSEGFSLAILEAGASGLPLIVTHGCKFPDVSRYTAGIEVSPDVNEIYNALYKILTDDRFRKKAAKNARRLVLEKYTIEAMAKEINKLYKNII